MWFVLEALGPMPDEALDRARIMLVDGLLSLSPGAHIEATLLARGEVSPIG